MSDEPITFSDNIPPPTDRRGGKQSMYPWDMLEVGQSFFVPGKASHEIGGALNWAAQKRGTKYVSRSEGGGVRVWRTE
jgi:hypothetical protein